MFLNLLFLTMVSRHFRVSKVMVKKIIDKELVLLSSLNHFLKKWPSRHYYGHKLSQEIFYCYPPGFSILRCYAIISSMRIFFRIKSSILFSVVDENYCDQRRISRQEETWKLLISFFFLINFMRTSPFVGDKPTPTAQW